MRSSVRREIACARAGGHKYFCCPGRRNFRAWLCFAQEFRCLAKEIFWRVEAVA